MTTPCNFSNSSIKAGHGRPTTPVPKRACKPFPPRCDCHVIGINTVPTPINSNTFFNVTIDSGDADFFLPYYMAVVAFEAGVNGGQDIVNLGIPLPLVLVDSRSGQEPNMRRSSQVDTTFGVSIMPYGFQKHVECVDWRRFGSTPNQELILRFFNCTTVRIHVFVNLWGIAGIAAR